MKKIIYFLLYVLPMISVELEGRVCKRISQKNVCPTEKMAKQKKMVRKKQIVEIVEPEIEKREIAYEPPRARYPYKNSPYPYPDVYNRPGWLFGVGLARAHYW